MSYSSQLLQDAVDALTRLPGIGKKSALRLALFLIKEDKHLVNNEFVEPIRKMVNEVKFCSSCHNLSDESICVICQTRATKAETLCVVESVRDVMAIEETGQYNGLYHVLGGVISPLDGVGPEDINVDTLIESASRENIKEIIMAISPTIEGETTIYYISKKLQGVDVRISQLARGISFGGELEYADELTLGRSIVSRTPYNLS